MGTFGRLFHETLRVAVPRPMKNALKRRFPRLRARLPILPFMDPAEVRLIESYLHENTRMLEFGCGGSTLHFARKVKRLFAIEHDREWFERMKSRVPDNVTLRHVAKGPDPEGNRVVASSWEELTHSTRWTEFGGYIGAPKSFGTVFDVVLIDGRARPECARAILPLLATDGIVFIHDYFMRAHYRVVEEGYDVVEHLDQTGQTLVALRPKQSHRRGLQLD